ncbi:hypothetical protein LCGC14_2040990, partial [marine sediment metagenome]
SLNRTIFVKYSPFNLSFVNSVDFFDVIYKEINQTDAEPEGQNSSHGIFQITSDAYDGNINIWARYNNSPHECLTKQTFAGTNYSNPTQGDLKVYESERANSGSGIQVFNATWLAQTFTVGEESDDERFDINNLTTFFESASATQSDEIIISIRAVNSSNAPTGPDLDNGSLDNLSIFGSSGNWKNVTLNQTFFLNEGTQYAIIMKVPNATGGKATWQTAGNNVYPGGQRWSSSNSGVSWSVIDTFDFMFIVEGFDETFGTNLNITNLTVDNQIIVSDIDSSQVGNVFSYNMINCSAYTFAFIPFEYICFSSRCSECVPTQDFTDNCDVMI